MEIVMQTNNQKAGLDPAANIYRNINFLTIKKSARMILSLEGRDLEDFVKKYSIIVIYLLNVTEQDMSMSLLEKLSNHSILYLMEEELRTIIIREFAEITDDFETLTDLSAFLDLIDKPSRSDRACECSDRALQHLTKSKQNRGKEHFRYLDNLPAYRRENILKIIISRSIHTALGVLVSSHDDIMCELMDSIAFHRSRDLIFVPASLFDIRFKKNYNLYLNEKVMSHLPAEVLFRLRSLDDLYRKHESIFVEMNKTMKSDFSHSEKRQKVLDLAYSLLQRTEPEMKEMLLTELIRLGAITATDEPILRSLS